MTTKIANYIRAGYPALYLITPEEQRAEGELKRVAQELHFSLLFWSTTDGLVDASTGTILPKHDPIECLQSIGELPEKSIVLLRDFHLFLADPNPFLIRTLKDVLKEAKTTNKCLIILGCRLNLPPELEREITVLNLALPINIELSLVLDGIIESAKIEGPAADVREAILNSAKGLTTIEAENSFALSIVEKGHLNPEIIAQEKAQVVKKNGLLEIVEPSASLEDIGGLEILKAWLLNRKNAFTRKAQEYGLPTPKGLLITGIPGTGKSMVAKTTANIFELPLLKLDGGRIFAGLVGQSESNLRSIIQTAEAIAPCCLWIDEAEKAFAGSKSSGSTDGGTSARVFGSFLNWMQEKRSPVFVVATANDVTQLPPELLRKGRWDELFFVDLPNEEERKSIWALQIGKYGRNPKEYDLIALSRMTEGFTGSEIEQAFIESLYLGFEQGREPGALDLAQVITAAVPLARTMAEQINALRNWAKGRARNATISATSTTRSRKLAA